MQVRVSSDHMHVLYAVCLLQNTELTDAQLIDDSLTTKISIGRAACQVGIG